jgi:hypothetical protein
MVWIVIRGRQPDGLLLRVAGCVLPLGC